MAVQFQSAPAFHPSPFVIYNNNKNNTLTDIGEALGALGNMPNQFQQAQIRDNLNQLLIKALTAPKTEMQAQPDTLKPGYSISEDIPDSMESIGTFGGSLAGYTPDMGTIGDMLTKAPPKEVPGKDYTEATNRLGDVGYAGGGFNFAKKNKLEDLLTLETVKSQNKLTQQEQKDKAAADRLEKREKTRMDLASQGIKARSDLEDKRIKSNESISQKTLGSREKVAAAHEANNAQYHMEVINQQNRRNNILQKSMESLDDVRDVNAAKDLTNKMNSTLASIMKLKTAGNPNDPQINSALRTLMNNYNQDQAALTRVDPGTPTTPLTEQNTPFGFGNLGIVEKLPGKEPSIDIVPGTPKPAAPNKPATSETPLQRRNRLLGVR